MVPAHKRKNSEEYVAKIRKVTEKAVNPGKYTRVPSKRPYKLPSSAEVQKNPSCTSMDYFEEKKLRAAFAALREGKDHLLTEFLAKYENTCLHLHLGCLYSSGASAVARGLQVNSTIVRIDLSFHKIGDEGVKAISLALLVNRTLDELKLLRNNIGPAGAKAIADMLKVNQTLSRLNLRANQIDDDGAFAIGEALKDRPSACSVDLRCNNLSVASGPVLAAVAKQRKFPEYRFNEISFRFFPRILYGIPFRSLRENKITELDLDAKGLGPAEAAVLAELLKVNRAVQTLNIGANNIGAKGAELIAQAVKVNETLQTLSIVWNEIGEQGAEHIAEALQDHPSVTSVDLRGNKLSVASGSALAAVAKQNPRISEMCGILLDSLREAVILAEFLKDNHTLTSLDLYDNAIGDGGAKAIGDGLKVNASVTYVSLNRNQIGDAGAVAISKSVEVNQTLRELKLRNNRIGDDGAHAVGEALKDHPSVTSVDLRDNDLSVASGLALVAVVKQNPRIQELCGVPLVNDSLRDGKTHLSSVGPAEEAIFVEVFKINTTLETLSLRDSYIGPALADLLKENKTLRELDMAGNSTGSDGAKAIAKALEANKVLQTLDIGLNKIGDEVAAAIADVLKVNTSLTNLQLNRNCIGPEGAKRIAKALQVNQTLRELNLRYNGIGDDGVYSIGEALKVNKSLKVLSLWGNKIGPEGAEEIAAALEVNSSLTSLELDIDDGPQEVKHIAKALQVNKTLQELHLGGNYIGDGGAHSMWEALQVNSTLRTLSLGLSDIGAECAKALEDMLKVNTSLTSLQLEGKDIGPSGAKHIAKALQVNQSIERMYIQGNWIPVAALVIASLLMVNQTLREVNLRANRIGDDVAHAIGEALKVNTSLTSLQLEGKDIGPSGAKHIAKALQVNQSIERMYIQGNWIPVASFRDGKTTSMDLSHEGYDSRSALVIASLLMVNQTLREVNLRANRIRDDGAHAIGEALKDHPSVTSVDLRKNGLSVASGSVLVAVVKQNPRIQEMCGIPLDLLRENKTTELDLSSEGLGPAEAVLVAEFMKVNQSIEHIFIQGRCACVIAALIKVNSTVQTLNLDCNKIGPDGAKAIGKALEVNKTLREIELGRNDIEDEGAQAIGEALKANKVLQRLNIEGNGIGDKCVAAFADALKVNTSLTSLDFESNYIKQEGAKQIANALEANKVLQTLNIARNNIGDQGAAAFADALKVNTSLTQLCLHNNGIDDAGVTTIAKALQDHPSITSVDLRWNKLSVASGSALAAVAKQNPRIREMCGIPLDSLRENKTTKLDLSFRYKLGPAGAALVADFVKANQSLEKLCLWYNEILPEGAEAIAAVVEDHPSVTSVDLRNNDLSVASGSALAAVAKKNPRVREMCGIPLDLLRENKTTELDLSDKSLESAEAVILAEFLKLNKSLKALSLAKNKIGQEGASAIAAVLEDHPSVTSVDLRNNDLSVASGSTLAAVTKQNSRIREMCGIPLDLLRENKTTELDLSGKSLGPAEAALVAEFVKVNQALTTFRLHDNRIGTDGAMEIAAALKVNKSLKALSLTKCDIGPEEAVILAEFVKVNQALTTFRLHDNRIGTDGAKEIAAALKVNKSLKALSLTKCDIGPKGAEAIAAVVEGHPSITSLDLRSNKLSVASGSTLAAVAKQNPRIREMCGIPLDLLRENKTTELDLSGRSLGPAKSLGPAEAVILAEFVKENSALRELDVRDNDIGDDGAEAIGKVLEINPLLENVYGVELKDSFETLPSEVLQHGNKGILQYLRSVQSSGTRPSYQGKIVFLGDMGVGKTSLMHTLQGKSYQGTSTVGVDIQEWAVTHPDPAVKEPLTLSTWDFAGQEMYYSAHQIFLSRHSLFMLAWDPSTTEEVKGAVTKLNFWLKSIQARVDAPQVAGESKSTDQGAREASKPKVFVVATRRDNQRPTPKGYEDEIRKLYSSLELAFYHVSTVGEKEGIEELRRDLTQAAASQKGMGQKLARSWFDFRQAVLAKRGSDPYVDSWTLLEQWAEDCNLETEAIDAVLQYLHLCGSVLYFPEIGRLLITSPQWLSDALRRVITHEQRTDQAQCGLLTEQKRDEAWKDYPESLRKKLGALMEQFELSFRVYEQGPHLFPSMLPLARPRSAELLAPLPSEHQLGVSLVLSVLPPPLLPRFLCRMHKYLPEPSGSHASGLGLKISCWAKGFLMFHDQQRGVVEVGRRNNRSLELQVRGSYPRYFLDEALRTLYCLLEDKFPSIEVQKEEVTCPKCHSPESDVSRENLVRAPAGAQFQCHRCLQSSQVRDWLGDFLAEKYGVKGLVMSDSTSKENSSPDLGWPLEQLVSEVELRRQQQAKGSTEGEVDRELELAAKACRLMNLVQLNTSQSNRSKLFPSKEVLVPVACGKELDFKKGDPFALHLLCEHSKGWHIPKEAEKKTVQRELGPELLQKLAPHLQLCLELIKSTGCVVKDAFEAVLKVLTLSGAADKAQGTKLAAFIALGDYLAQNKELHGLSLCRDSTGEERWLCGEHKALLASPTIFKEKPDEIFVSLNPDMDSPEEIERKRAEHKQQLLKEVEKLKKQDGILQRLQEYQARPPRIKYYGFLSHYQKEGADACRAIFLWLAEKNLDMWLDKKAKRLDLPGMVEGIAESACFVLWGTGGYFDRPFCLFELEIARLLKKPIVCIRESDDRMYPLSFQDLCRADPQLVLHDVVAVNREYYDAFADKIAHRLRVSWAHCQPAAAAKEPGPVSSVKQAAAGSNSELTQAQLDAVHAVDLDADSLALTSDEDLEALFKELNVSMATKIKIKAAKKKLTQA
eukprot:g14005.t1